MRYEQWLALGEARKASLQEHWNPYGPGYWHQLVEEASSRFRAEFESKPHVLDVIHGVYHGGQLIIGAHRDLPYPNKALLPEMCAGFPVYQFGVPGPEAPGDGPRAGWGCA